MSKNEKNSLIKLLAQNQKGMSLPEILVAITLVGLAGTYVATNVFDRLQEGRAESAKIQIQKLSENLKDYRRKCNSYPTTDQGLEALVTKPTGGNECKRYPSTGFIEGSIPKDPWDLDFIYESDGRSFKIISYGSDNAEGGEGFEADISSEDL